MVLSVATVSCVQILISCLDWLFCLDWHLEGVNFSLIKWTSLLLLQNGKLAPSCSTIHTQCIYKWLIHYPHWYSLPCAAVCKLCLLFYAVSVCRTVVYLIRKEKMRNIYIDCTTTVRAPDKKQWTPPAVPGPLNTYFHRFQRKQSVLSVCCIFVYCIVFTSRD